MSVMRDEDRQMDIEHGQPKRGANDVVALKYIVGRHSELAGEIDALKEEQKELEGSAWEKCGKSAKAIKQLSKEWGWDTLKREARHLLEEEIDHGRAALGMLAGTPLGEAEMERMRMEEKVVSVDGAAKKRGRPKGSRNRLRAVGDELPPAA